MFDPRSDYALNKMAPDAIAYMDTVGKVARLTLADFEQFSMGMDIVAIAA